MKKIIFFLGLIISTSAFSQTESTDLIGSDSSKVDWDLLYDLMIKEVNSERAKLNLPEMIKDSNAMVFAKTHTLNMKEKGLYHSNSEIYGECCLQAFLSASLTYEAGAKVLISIWKESKPHWKILMGDYKICGVSVITYEKSKFVSGYPVRASFVITW